MDGVRLNKIFGTSSLKRQFNDNVKELQMVHGTDGISRTAYSVERFSSQSNIAHTVTAFEAKFPECSCSISTLHLSHVEYLCCLRTNFKTIIPRHNITPLLAYFASSFVFTLREGTCTSDYYYSSRSNFRSRCITV